jgi:hypothetical protein
MIDDIKNIIIKDIFTKDEMKIIYDQIKSTPDDLMFLHPLLGQKAFFVGMPKVIEEKVLKVAQETTKTKIKLTEISAVRYSNHYKIKPNLYPHIDGFSEPRLTLDIQLKSTLDWDIYVEKIPFRLNDNEGLTFYGTNQVHWRDRIDFKDDDFMDMLFCHFSEDSEDPYKNTEEFKDFILKRELELLEEYGEPEHAK